jgi:hypothetical protein
VGWGIPQVTRTWKVIAWMLGLIGTSFLGVFGFHISRGG